MDAEQIARVCHEANRGLTQILQDVPVQPPWDDVSADMRQSAITGVLFALANPMATAAETHAAWCIERFKQGWVLGEVKSDSAKTHPALRPFHELPEGVRKKDALFRAIVQALK